MNETTNVELVKSGYERFGSGDIAGLLALFASDITWTVPEIENASFSGKRKGIDATGEFFRELTASEDITSFEPREFVAQGDRVVVLGHSTATVRDTGKSYETDWVHVFLVRDGKVTEFQEFFDNAAATRAFQRSAAA